MLRSAAIALVLAPLLLPDALRAQGGDAVRLEVSLVADASRQNGRVPEVRVRGLLDDDRWISSLRSGLPLRLHYRLELWRSRGSWFDALNRTVEWDVVVRREPLLDQYSVTTVLLGRTRHRRYPDLGALDGALSTPYRITVRPEDKGEFYYAVTLQVSTLSDADLDEMDRFLRGEAGPGPEEDPGVGDAVGRTARRFLLRVAGLPLMRVEGKSGKFRVR
jgi:hypothetical protein